ATADRPQPPAAAQTGDVDAAQEPLRAPADGRRSGHGADGSARRSPGAGAGKAGDGVGRRAAGRNPDPERSEGEGSMEPPRDSSPRATPVARRLGGSIRAAGRNPERSE